MLATALFAALVTANVAANPGPAAPATTTAIVAQDQVSLRAAPHDAARQQAVLWAGEAVEVRGQKLDYVQVWDHKRERGGFVPASSLRRIGTTPADVPELMAVLRFVRDTPGSEALGIAYAAAYIVAAPAEVLNGEQGIEALDILGTLADRLAQHASSGGTQSKAAANALSAHLDVARGYGIVFGVGEREGNLQVCYDGDAFRRVLAMRSNAVQRAHAALGLTRPECVNPELAPLERRAVDEWRAGVLDRVDIAAVPAYLKNRILMRRAGVWSGIAYERARMGEAPDAAAERAMSELAGIVKAELTDDDVTAYNDAAIRVSTSRWAAMPGANKKFSAGLSIDASAGQSGETCVTLTDAKHDAAHALARRCTFGLVWIGSATLNRENNALALAVQPLDGWREMWLFRKQADAWNVSVLPPASLNPGIGYVEFAGWVPGGKQMLLAREAKGDGKYKRNFEQISLASLAPEHQATDPSMLAAFKRWQDPAWKAQTVSLR
jgi:hypothetical protein